MFPQIINGVFQILIGAYGYKHFFEITVNQHQQFGVIENHQRFIIEFLGIQFVDDALDDPHDPDVITDLDQAVLMRKDRERSSRLPFGLFLQESIENLRKKFQLEQCRSRLAGFKQMLHVRVDDHNLAFLKIEALFRQTQDTGAFLHIVDFQS